MRKRLVLFALLAMGAAQGALIQEDFEALATGPGVPPGWFEGYHGPGASWETVEIEGNKVLKGISGPPTGGDASTGPDNGTGWYVENYEMQVSLSVLSGRGGGIAIGQFDTSTYTGNSYFVEMSLLHSAVGLWEEGLSGGGTMGIVYLPEGSLVHGAWYDLRMVSTGTTIQVWWRPHTTAAWSEGDKIIEVAHDILHPGHKSYVDGFAGCWSQNNNGPSTVLFDDFYLEATPFPAPMSFSDDFEDGGFSLANWSAPWSTLDFPVVGGSQVAQVTTGDRTGGIGLGLSSQYYTHNFVLQTSIYVDESFSGGIAWGWEGTATGDCDFHIQLGRDATDIHLDFDEEQNSTSGTDETQLALYTEAAPPGVYWYTIEVVADYEYYDVWLWQRGTPKPVSPVISIPQDLAHPGYRLVNAGAVALWLNPNRTAYFDDFYFSGTETPSENTPPSEDPVVVEPEEVPEMSMTFDAVTEGGATTVETSVEAPGGGPGGLEFEGLYYDINTTCVYEGPILISIAYDDTGMTQEQEENLRLMHWITADQVWVDVTVPPVDTVNNIITGETTSLSVFAIASMPQFVGFLSPINMPPEEMSVFKQKSTVPVKFQLLNAQTGEPVTDAVATIWGQLVADGVPGEVNEALETKVPDMGINFRYSEEEGLYIYNLSTKSLLPGCAYRIHANIMDGLMDQWVDIALK